MREDEGVMKRLFVLLEKLVRIVCVRVEEMYRLFAVMTMTWWRKVKA